LPVKTNTRERVAGATSSARPYVERAIRDRELRQNVRSAYTSARAVYDQLSRRRGMGEVAAHLASDEDLQTELRKAIEAMRSAAARVQGVQRDTEEPTHSGRNGLLLLAGIVIGLLVNPVTGPMLRRFLAKRLFGEGNGFVYRDNGSVT
jgi:hypothetical protein